MFHVYLTPTIGKRGKPLQKIKLLYITQKKTDKTAMSKIIPDC